MKKIILLTFLALSINAYSQKLVKTYWDYSKKKVQTEYYTDAYGTKNGAFKGYSEYGGILMQGTFKDGKPIGKWIENYENGKLHFVKVYNTPGYNNLDVVDGKITSYYENGVTLKYERNFKNAELDGDFKEYNESGTLVKEGKYVNGVFKSKGDEQPTASTDQGIFAEIQTAKGKIVIQLEYQKTPITVANFISLAEGTNASVVDEKLKGKPFYDGLKFHRVIADFMIQGGDPAGNGSGGPGYAFKDEFTDAKFDRAGILAMANSGPKTNGSQFFITHKNTDWLTGKHTIFGYVITGQDVVNKIAQDDVIDKITIVRKGTDAKKYDAAKTFAEYMANKAGDDAKDAAIAAESNKKQAELEAQKKAEYNAKFGAVITAKAKYLNDTKATATETASGLKYKIIKAGTGKKPTEGVNVYINYAGYLEDGSLFDSNFESVNKECGKYDENRAKQNGYQPFPFPYGKKDGLIPGFIEGLSLMNFGDRALIYIPSKLGYGERGAGNVIPPNANIIFEIEMLETAPAPPAKQ